jgi:hypothetical protein
VSARQTLTDILVFNDAGQGAGRSETHASGGGFQPDGPAIGLAFEHGFQGGRLFATDSNQAIRTPGAQNNSSRIVIVNPDTGAITPFIVGLPTGDHPAQQLAFKSGWIYWSQGSTTNSGVVGRDNGSGANKPDIRAGRHAQQQRVRLGRRGPHQRLLPVRRRAPRGNGAGVL